METQINKLAIAEVLGTKAFNEGMKRVFALDKEAVELLTNKVGDPKNHKIMVAWYANWDLSSLRASV